MLNCYKNFYSQSLFVSLKTNDKQFADQYGLSDCTFEQHWFIIHTHFPLAFQETLITTLEAERFGNKMCIILRPWKPFTPIQITVYINRNLSLLRFYQQHNFNNSKNLSHRQIKVTNNFVVPFKTFPPNLIALQIDSITKIISFLRLFERLTFCLSIRSYYITIPNQSYQVPPY